MMMMMMMMILLSYGLHPLARLIACFCRTHPLNAGPPVADNNNDGDDDDDDNDFVVVWPPSSCQVNRMFLSHSPSECRPSSG